MTLNTILKEIKGVPAERLEEVYSFIHSLSTKTKKSDSLRKKILNFAGAFKDMSKNNYVDFIQETKNIRTNFLDRKV